MSFPFENFKIESSKDAAFQIKHLCAEKLNNLNDVSLEVKKEQFNNCQIKMTGILNLLSRSNDNNGRKLKI